MYLIISTPRGRLPRSICWVNQLAPSSVEVEDTAFPSALLSADSARRDERTRDEPEAGDTRASEEESEKRLHHFQLL